MSRRPGKPEPRYRWILPVAITIAVAVLVWVVVTTVANGTFL